MSALNELRRPGFSRATVRVVVWFFFGVAVLVGILTLVFGSIEIISALASGHTQLTLVAEHALPAAAHGGKATIVSGGYESAAVTITGAAAGVVVIATISSIATVLTKVALASVIAVMAWRILRGSPFRRSVALAVTIGGAVLLIGGILAEVSPALGNALAATELNGSGRFGFWPLAGRFDPTTIVIGVVLLLVGLAFEYGERLQRDTEGLV